MVICFGTVYGHAVISMNAVPVVSPAQCVCGGGGGGGGGEGVAGDVMLMDEVFAAGLSTSGQTPNM